MRSRKLPLAPSRRRFLLGLGAVAAAPAVVVLPTAAGAHAVAPSASSAPRRGAAAEPECLADLIESGEVTRADLMAG